MSTSINIFDFVGKDDIRAWMREPIQIAGKLAATDGRTMFVSNKRSNLPDPETTSLERIENFLEIAAAADFYPIPELSFPEMPPCAECKGSGKHDLKTCPECDGFGDAEAETDYNTYDVEYKTCGGAGKVESGQPVGECQACGGKGKCWTEIDRMKVKGIPFDMNPNLMSRIAGVPDMQIAPLENTDISKSMAFKCADGIGIIMGMRDAT